MCKYSPKFLPPVPPRQRDGLCFQRFIAKTQQVVSRLIFPSESLACFVDLESEWNRITVPSINGTESQSHNYRLLRGESRSEPTRQGGTTVVSAGWGCWGPTVSPVSSLRLPLRGPGGWGGTNGNKPEPIEGQAERRSPNISPRLPGRLIEVSFPAPSPVPSQLAQSGEALSSGPTQGRSW